jgi:hypothetical protein
MKSLNALLFTILAIPAAIVNADDSGKTQVSTTDRNGTTVTTETSHKDSVGYKGETKQTSEARTVVDPKGMMNKELVSKTSEKVVKPNGDYSRTDTIKHADGTFEKASSEKNTNEHLLDTGKTTTRTETHTVDPKGLGNKQSMEHEEKVVTEPDGSSKKTVTQELNNRKIYEETSPK